MAYTELSELGKFRVQRLKPRSPRGLLKDAKRSAKYTPAGVAYSAMKSRKQRAGINPLKPMGFKPLSGRIR
jgi:hypothetical protein